MQLKESLNHKLITSEDALQSTTEEHEIYSMPGSFVHELQLQNTVDLSDLTDTQTQTPRHGKIQNCRLPQFGFEDQGCLNQIQLSHISSLCVSTEYCRSIFAFGTTPALV
jgi:hypothetical protein